MAGFIVLAAFPGIMNGARAMVTWATIVFFSLLVHELGHALMAYVWGSRVIILLTPFGGVTQMDPPLSRKRSIVASLVGPLVSIAIGACLAMIRAHVPPATAITLAMWVNLAWGAVNLLPILPFDGGHVLVTLAGPARASIAPIVSASVAGAIALVSLVVARSAGATLVFGLAAAASIIEWVKLRRHETEARLGVPLQIAEIRALLAEGRCIEALSGAKVALRNTRTKASEIKVRELLAWAHLGLGRTEAAREVLVCVRPPGAIDVYCWAATEAACGGAARAIAALEATRDRAGLHASAIKLLIDLHVRQKDMKRACSIARHDLQTLGLEDTRLVLDAAIDEGAFRPAADLAHALHAITAAPQDAIARAYALARLGRSHAAKAALALAANAPEPEDEVTRARLRELTALEAHETPPS